MILCNNFSLIRSILQRNLLLQLLEVIFLPWLASSEKQAEK